MLSSSDTPQRCAVCGWTLSDDKAGCRRGDCSLRPPPERLYDRERALAEHHPISRAALERRYPAPTPQESINDDVNDELRRAVAKFPTWPTDPLHALAVLGEEFGELTKAVLQLTYEPQKSSAEHVREEAIQTAAMALRFARSLARYEYTRGEQHEQ
jgi:NTP pyrophosphatase (non-canonical NTP hydrolase)